MNQPLMVLVLVFGAGCAKRQAAPVTCLREEAPSPHPMAEALAKNVCAELADHDFEKDCLASKWTACEDAARARVSGCRVARDEKRALELATRGCDGGELTACNYLGLLYADGRASAPDLTRAALLYHRACAGHLLKACVAEANLYSNGAGVKQDLPRALKILTDACDAEDAGACNDLGVVYEQQKNFPRAVELYQKSCDAAYAEGCKSLGLMFAYGKGVTRDLARAKVLYRDACKKGVGAACDHLSVFYADEGDFKDAFDLETLACGLEDAHGCANLGAFYMNGQATPADARRGVELFEQSCRAGETLGCRFYARSLDEGGEHARSVACLKWACDHGDEKACTH